MGRLIDIDRLCNDLAKRWSIADKKKEDLIRAVMADVVTPIVVSQPPVDAVPVRHGRWIVLDECSNVGIYCSVCRKKVMRIDFSNTMGRKNFRFCPNCGAKNRKDGEHDKTERMPQD